MKKKTITRRNFIKNSALAAGGITIVPRFVLGGRGFTAPSDKVNLAVVGVGDRAFGNMRDIFKLDDVQITSIADPALIWAKQNLYNKESGRGPAKELIENHYAQTTPNYKITDYEDFRIMLEKEKSIDAILCASPDNTHAYISIHSMRAGKHVYCEKPLAHNIWEARKIREVAKETKVATQMGNQLHAGNNLRKTVGYLRSGIIGKVKEVHSWVGSSRQHPGIKGMPKEATPTPNGLNWDLWLGPTPWHAFNDLYAPFTWRDFWVFGNGAMGDFGCHDMDTAVWAFDLDAPGQVEVIPSGNRGSSEVASYGSIGYFDFEQGKKKEPFHLTFYTGGLHPRFHELLPREFNIESRGALYIGDKGIIITNGWPNSEPQIFPQNLREPKNLAEVTPSQSPGHHREWIDAIKGGAPAMSNFEYGTKLTEITLLGVLSLRLGGKKIIWDAEKMKVVGNNDADAIIKEPVRLGWEMA